jgi:hypothetical protein
MKAEPFHRRRKRSVFYRVGREFMERQGQCDRETRGHRHGRAVDLIPRRLTSKVRLCRQLGDLLKMSPGPPFIGEHVVRPAERQEPRRDRLRSVLAINAAKGLSDQALHDGEGVFDPMVQLIDHQLEMLLTLPQRSFRGAEAINDRLLVSYQLVLRVRLSLEPDNLRDVLNAMNDQDDFASSW